MAQVLLIESSATLRHAAKKLISNAGYVVTEVSKFSEGLQKLNDVTLALKIDAVVLGWPAKTDHTADELFAVLEEKTNLDIAVVVLSHESDTARHSWFAKRRNTALVLWGDYLEIIDSLDSQISTTPRSAFPVIQNKHVGTAVRVLFVDDSPTVRATYRRLLTKYGYETETAACVEEGMDKALQEKYDIAIIDYYLPDGTGDSLCARLRDEPFTSHIVTAVITGTYSDKAIISSLAAGAVECMFKNEPKELFIARINAMSRSISIMSRIQKESEHLQGILASVGDGVYGVDFEGKITFINPAAKEILGLKSDESMVGSLAQDVIHPSLVCDTVGSDKLGELQDAYRNGSAHRGLATSFRHALGNKVPVECTVYPLTHEQQLQGSVVAFRDVSERMLLLEELKWQANHDSLTKLPNRSYFEQQLMQEVKRLRRSNETSALLYIDLDRFKYVNDTADHIVGDCLLVAVGNQLRRRLRSADLLARIGGDEFAIIMRNICDEDIFHAADHFRNVLENYQFVHDGLSYKITTSIGIAQINKETNTAGEVLANADIACYIAKGKGRNTTHMYHSDSDEKTAMDIELGWSARIHDAIKHDKFSLYYQPIMALNDIDFSQLPEKNGELWEQVLLMQSTNILRYEVLLRLPDARGNMISPAAFLPTAERFNMMNKIDRWVIKTSIASLAMQLHNEHSIKLSINLSGQTLEDVELGEYIDKLVKLHKVDPESITFEITETSAIANLEAANRFMNDVHELGCHFSLDDFGSGFCSFSHLKYLTVDTIKIDGIFVQGMLQDDVDRAIVESIVQIAHSVGKKTVAEFVENAEILKLLKEIGVDYIQGYYLSMPRQSIDGNNDYIPELQVHDNNNTRSQ